MAATIGARIEVDGEQQYTQSIKRINQETKELKSEMDLLVSSFDKSASAEEQAAAKTDILTKQIANQEQKVDILSRKYADEQKELERLKAEMEKATTEYGANSKEAQKATQEYNKFASQTSKTKTELNNAKTELNKMRGELEDAKNPTQEEAQAAKEMGDNLKDAGEKGLTFGDVLKANLASQAIVSGVKALAKAIKDVATGIVSTVTETLEWADGLNELSTKTGLSTTRLQEFEYMADLIDTDVETITGSLTKLVKNMNTASKGTGDAAAAFEALGVEVVDSNGELRDAETVFNEVIDALGSVENETQRDAYAMNIFGKSARDLNPLIAAGSEALAAYAQEAHDVGYVLDDDMLEPMNAAKDALDRMKRALEGTKRQLVAAFAPQLADTLERFLPTLQNMGNVLMKILEPALNTISKLISGVSNALSRMTPAQTQSAVNFGMIAAAIGPIIPALSQSLPLLKGVGSALLALGPVGAIVAGVAAGLGALAVHAIRAEAESRAAAEAFAADTLALTDEQAALIAAGTAAASAFEATRLAAEDASASLGFQRDRAEDLATQLFALAGADGYVAEEDRAHAQIIIDELNEAYGLEIEMVDGQIQAYDDLQESIYDVINAKTAEALLDRNRDAYLTALENEAALTDAVAAAQEALADGEADYANAIQNRDRVLHEAQQNLLTDTAAEAAAREQELREWQQVIDDWESTTRAEREAALSSAMSDYQSASRTIQNFEAAQIAAQRGNTQEVIDLMTGRAQAWTDYGDTVDAVTAATLDDMYEEVLKAAEHARTVRENWENGVDGYTEDMVTEAQNAYQAILGEFDSFYTDATGIGADFMDGLDNGLRSRLNQLKQAANAIAGVIPRGVRTVLDEHSPSRVAEEIGALFGDGLAIGIDESTRKVLSAAEDQADALTGAYETTSALMNTDTGILAGTTSNAFNYGGFTIMVNGAPGQDEEELADIVMERIQHAVQRREAVFA